MTADQKKLEIINLGLYLISQTPLQSLTENTVNANVALDVYDSCVEECLRGNNWPFASVTDTLVLSTTYTAVNYKYAYIYPANAAAVWLVYNLVTPDKRKGEEFRRLLDPVAGSNVIVTNTPDAIVEYTYLVTDPNLFDASFVNMLSYRLAAAMAMPLNADADQAVNMTKVFSNQMSEAQRSGSYEDNRNDAESKDVFVNARSFGPFGPGSNFGNGTFSDFNSGNLS